MDTHLRDGWLEWWLSCIDLFSLYPVIHCYLVVDASIFWSLKSRLRNTCIFTKPTCERDKRVYYSERSNWLHVQGLTLILTNDQLYKPTNVRSNVKRSAFRHDRWSNDDGFNPIKSNVSNQCQFPMGRAVPREVRSVRTNPLFQAPSGNLHLKLIRTNSVSPFERTPHSSRKIQSFDVRAL